MKRSICIAVFCITLATGVVSAGSNFSRGKITSLLASGTDPAIRMEGNISPDNCDGGNWGWLYFKGTGEERSRIYASALALSLSGIIVTAYTNSDGGKCRIINIQAVDLNN